jgi:hypothetical protein
MRFRDHARMEDLEKRVEELERTCIRASQHNSTRPQSVLMFKDDAETLETILEPDLPLGSHHT